MRPGVGAAQTGVLGRAEAQRETLGLQLFRWLQEGEECSQDLWQAERGPQHQGHGDRRVHPRVGEVNS